ncbi:PAS domain S-box protein [Nodosilinea sp. E11]|uniref:PAS domain S-box protein n=1 Tax=Nodosilinea sp. E11 TaxID=3037479 RepID=UPI002934258A|nr:PAS domain S-box protein [Nodosilinea sp. E11]WOD36970.1 PAS domain S-box protein [Nodosilinea sp. E11]
MANPKPTALTAAIIHDPLTIEPGSSVMSAIALMSDVRTLCPIDRDHTAEESLHPEARSSCVVVVDNDQVVGILTERDVVRLSAQQQPLDQLLVAEAMAHPVITRRQSDLVDLISTIDLLRQQHIRHLPIVDEQNRLVGLITHESLRQLTRPVDLLRLRLVHEVMTAQVLTAGPDRSMLEIARLMADRRVSSVVIMVPGGSADAPFQQAVGLLTERDLVQFQSMGLSWTKTTAQTVMSSPVFSVAPEVSLWEVQQIMEQCWVRRLVVAGEQGELLGIVTQTSLLRVFNPVELYQLAKVLEQKVTRLETERIALLQSQAAALEWHTTESNQAITAKKAVEEELQRREARYRALMEGASDAILLANPGGYLIEVNPQAVELLGYENHELVGMHFSQLHPPDSLPHVAEAFAALVKRKRIHNLDLEILRRDGQRVPVDITGSAIEVGGEIIIQSIFHDVRDRRQTEQAFRDSELRFRRVFESNVVGMMFTDFNGRISDANDRFLEMLGYTRQELESGNCLNWAELTPPEYQAQDQAAIAHLQHHNAIDPWEKVYRHKDGHWVPVLIGVAMLSREDESCVCVVVDISDRKGYETALQDSQQLLQTVLNTVPLSVFWKDRQSVILGCNQAFATAAGFAEPADVLGKNNFDLGLPQAEAESYTADSLQVVTSGIARLGIEETITPAGSEPRWVETNKLPLRDGAGTIIGVVGTSQDITVRKQAEQTLRQQTERETVLREITQRIRQSLDLRAILNTAVEQMQHTLQADRVAVYQFRPDWSGDFIAESVHEPWVKLMNPGIQKVWEDTYLQETQGGRFQNHEAFVIPDIYQADLQSCHIELLEQFQAKAFAIAPIFSGETLWGLLAIYQNETCRQWLHWEVDLLQQIANQLAIAIQQASLYKQVQTELRERQQAEAKITQQLRQQTALELILRQIRQSLDLPELLEIATQQVQELLQGDRVIVFQVCPNGQSHIVEEAVAPDLPRLKAMHWEDETWSQDILERYWQGQPRIVPDVMDDIWTDCLVDYSQAGQIQSKMVAPILQELRSPEDHRWVSPADSNKLWGVLVVHACHTRRVWQPEEAQLLQQIANQLAIAIQQSYLFDQLQQELTERQQAQAQLTQRNEELIRATRLKDEFLANMSHELRTPLNAILGMTEALQEKDVFGPVNAKQLKALKTVERSGSHLLELINDVLDVAKIEAGQVELDCAPTAIAPLCHSSLAFIKQLALHKRIQLTLNLPANLPTLYVDERRIRQVLINLLNNAVKFTPEGGQITLEVTPLEPTLSSAAPAYLQFAVTDTGIGITPAEQQRLFQPFVQVDSALNRQYQGTGLGLALVKRIVELHQGRVGLTSDVGVGSCFTFALPCGAAIPSPEPASIASLETPSPATTSAPAPLILLAEDNEANISTIVSYLQAKNYRVEIAYNGQEALDYLQHLRPDLILMDIQMPGMDGLEAIGHIRRDPSLDEVPVIALTSLAMPGDRDRCLAAGATEYLSKPVRLKQLVEIIQTLIPQTSSIPLPIPETQHPKPSP